VDRLTILAWLRHECVQNSFTAVVFRSQSVQRIKANRFATLLLCSHCIQSIQALP
jgi:hypothetical protein